MYFSLQQPLTAIHLGITVDMKNTQVRKVKLVYLG